MFDSDKIIRFEIVTPERIVFKEMVKQVSVPTTSGEITILPAHMPLVSNLKSGVVEFVTASGERNIASVSGGFIEVLRNKVVLLADTAERADEIDEAKAERARQKAIKSLKDLRQFDQERYTNISSVIAKELARTKAVNRWKKINKL